VLSVLFVFIFIAQSSYYNFVRNRTNTLRVKYEKEFSVFFSKLFLSDLYKTKESREVFYNNIRPLLKTRIQLVAFFDTYLRFQETLAVNLSEEFKILMATLKLQHKIEWFMYHRELDDKILAMKMLSYLRIQTQNKRILKYAQSKNIALRTEAYATLIRLMEDGEHLTKFIGEKHSLSLLDFNIIVNAVLKNNKMTIDYRALLASKKTRKIMIGLILAKYRFRKNKNNLMLIINHLYSNDEHLKLLAWEALLTLVPEDDAVDLVIDEFEKQTDVVKIAIIRNSKKIMTKKYLNFFKDIVKQQTLLVKIEIMRTFFEYDIDIFSSFQNSEDYEIEMAYNEISNIYLNL
jgi:hypothetical protein